MKKLRELTLTAIAVFFALSVFAQGTLWQGTVDTDWNNPANWSNGVPTTGYTATILGAASNFPTYAGSPIVDFTIENFGTLTFTGFIYNTGNIVNFSGADMANDGFFVNSGTVTFNNDGDFTNSGTFENYGMFDNANVASLDNLANAVYVNYGTIQNFGPVTNSGTFSNFGTILSTDEVINNGDFLNCGIFQSEQGSNLTNNAGGTFLTKPNSIFFVNSTFTNAGTLTNEGDMTFASASVIDNSGTIVNDNKLTNSGELTNDNVFTNNGEIFNKNEADLTNNQSFNNNGFIDNDFCGRITHTANNTIAATIINDGTIFNVGGGTVNFTADELSFVTTDINAAKPPVPGCTANRVFILGDNNSITVDALEVDKGSYAQCGATLVSQTINPSVFTQAGVFETTLRIEDNFGNVETCVSTITILDEPVAPPTGIDPIDNSFITSNCPANQTLQTLPGELTTPINYTIPTASSSCTGTTAGITLHGDCGFEGTSATLQVGSYPNISSFIANDILSSVTVPEGFIVTLYEHYNFGGSSVVLTADETCLSNINFDNFASSLTVAYVETPIVDQTPTNSGTNCNALSNSISGWIYMGTYQGSKYYCSNTNYTWHSAKHAAENAGGRLAIVESAGENNFIQSNLIGDYGWIGLTDEASEGNFKTVFGINPYYTNWNSGEPNNGGGTEHYTRILKSNGAWTDRNEHFVAEAVMEIPCPVTISGGSCENNLLSNTSFEEGTTGYSIWENTSLSYTDVTGQYSLRTTTAGSGGAGTSTFPASAGETFVFSGYSKVASSPSWAGVGITFYDANNVKLLEQSQEINSTSWEYFNYALQAPTGTVKARAYFWKSGTAGKIYVDDLCFSKVSTNGGPASNDGQVCEFNNFGTDGTNPNPRNIWWREDGQTGAERFSTVSSTFTEYPNGTATLSGTMVNTLNAQDTWDFEVNLINKRDWAAWSALGRSYKLEGTQSTDNHTDWNYYEIDNSNSSFTGTGANVGTSVSIFHDPADYNYGVQVGVGANLKDGDYGLSSWWRSEGAINGKGDFNADLDNCQVLEQCGDVTVERIAGPEPGGLGFGGTNQIAYKFTDCCGNEEICVFEVEVEVTPVTIDINCPSDVTVDAAICDNKATASWTEPTATSDCFEGGVVTITRTDDGPANGGTFTEGFTTIVYEIVDECGNTEFCVFNVIVNSPAGVLTFDCPSDYTTTLDPGQSSGVISWPVPTASTTGFDGVTEVRQVQGPENGSNIAAGAYSIIYFINDNCGNSEVCLFNVIINEGSDPCEDPTYIPNADVATTNYTCGEDNGSITFTFPNRADRTHIQFSLDGGNTWESSVADNTGSVTYGNLVTGDYDLSIRHGNGECPRFLETVTISCTQPAPCANNGGDADADGVCADVDCDDNDSSVGAGLAPGTACNDGDPNTINDRILADGCTCEGTVPAPCANNGGDADADGVCADVDCDDNDASVGAGSTPGTSCDDGNANTINDEILADGCTCEGTPNNGGGDPTVCEAEYTIDGNSITITGLDEPIVTVKILNSDWSDYEFVCDTWATVGTCDLTETVNNIPAGDYIVFIQSFDSGWNQVCAITETFTIGGTGPVDSDGDGTPDADDCAPNDANIPTTPGAACNDGNPNTSGDVYDATGCICAGTPNNGGNDADGDGTPDAEDCAPNNADFPAAPGSSCDDGDATTSGDVVGADGCSCAGTPNNGGGGDPTVCEADYTIDGNSITITGLDEPIVTVKILNADWSDYEFVCDTWATVGTCNLTETVTNIPNGDYIVFIQSYDSGWNQVCDIMETFTISGGNGPIDSDGDGTPDADDCAPNDASLPAAVGSACDDNNASTDDDQIQADGCTCAGDPILGDPDSDEDGTPDSQDCAPNDPTLPAAVGSACNDGDANTTNDEIQADGCTCAGTPNNGGGGDPTVCEADYTIDGNSITITGLDEPIVTVKILNADWSDYEFVCDTWATVGTCNLTETVNNIPAGDYIVFIQSFDSGWNAVCAVTETFTISGGGGTGPIDSDGDGTPDADDCAPTNADLPTAPGTSCNDFDASTENDVIGVDGCSCAGTPVGTGGCNVTFTAGASSITIDGLTDPIVSVKILDLNWNTLEECGTWVTACGTSQTFSDLEAGAYFVSVQTFDAGWNEQCNIFEKVDVGVLPFASSQDLRFDAQSVARRAELSWITNTELKNDYFVIERSIDGETFEAITEVQKLSNGDDANFYSINDENPNLGDNFYRVKQVYMDGTFEYSEAEYVAFNIDLANFDVYPNPTNNRLFVNLSEYVGQTGTIEIFNSFGQQMNLFDLGLINNDSFRIDVSDYQNGVYTITVKVSDRQFNTKMFVVSKL